MNEKTISVIIPCYNGARFLSEAIESIFAQTYREFEIIVVDDGSTDSSREVATRYPDVRLIRQKNQGVAVARNTGLHESRGDFLVFLDQDDRLLPNAFQVGMDCVNAHPESGFVFGLVRLIEVNGFPLPDIYQWNLQMAPYPQSLTYQMLLDHTPVTPLSIGMFRRAVFESIGGFDPSVVPMDDYDVCLRTAKRFPILCHNTVVVEQRQHRRRLSRSIAAMLKATLRIYNAEWKFVKGNSVYEAAYTSGRSWWQRQWGQSIPYEVIRKIRAGQFIAAFRALCVGLRYYPQGIFRFPLVLLLRLAKYCSSARQF